jgi:hypothetical protein
MESYLSKFAFPVKKISTKEYLIRLFKNCYSIALFAMRRKVYIKFMEKYILKVIGKMLKKSA